MQTDQRSTKFVSNAPQILHSAFGLDRESVDQCDSSGVAPKQFLLPSMDVPYSANLFATTPLTANFYTVFATQAPFPIVLNESALTLANHFTHPRFLADIPPAWRNTWDQPVTRSTLTQMVNLGLLRPANQPMPTPVEQPTTLSAWLHITDRCNLRCAYCYLPHHPVDMSPETGRAAVDATFRSALKHNYRTVKFKYAGGEAMLRFPLIIELHQHAQVLAKRHSLNLDGVILSNGTLLTPAIIEAMQANHLHLMISMDGLGQTHDQQRFYPNGRGSSAQVERAVELALTHNLRPDISVTVSSRTADDLPRLMAWLLARDLLFSLNFYRENDFSATHIDLQLEEEKIINGMLTAFKVIENNLPRHSLLLSLVDRANLASPHLRTCSVGHSYLVFDHSGRVAKCQMQINQPVTTTQADDPLALIQTDQIGIQNVSVEEKDGCRDCEWKYWCTGGCPLATYRATGRYDKKSPNCAIYKALYPEAVRLEGLRLLKFIGDFQVDTV